MGCAPANFPSLRLPQQQAKRDPGSLREHHVLEIGRVVVFVGST